MDNNNCFYKITNKAIYDKLIDIEKQVKLTNGKVKLNKWIATTAISLSCIGIGFIFSHIS